MKKKTGIVYTDSEYDAAVGTADEWTRDLPGFPSPEEVVDAIRRKRVTLNLTGRSVDRIKREAERIGVPYQSIIRTLVDEYAMKLSG